MLAILQRLFSLDTHVIAIHGGKDRDTATVMHYKACQSQPFNRIGHGVTGRESAASLMTVKRLQMSQILDHIYDMTTVKSHAARMSHPQ